MTGPCRFESLSNGRNPRSSHRQRRQAMQLDAFSRISKEVRYVALYLDGN